MTEQQQLTSDALAQAVAEYERLKERRNYELRVYHTDSKDLNHLIKQAADIVRLQQALDAAEQRAARCQRERDIAVAALKEIAVNHTTPSEMCWAVAADALEDIGKAGAE